MHMNNIPEQERPRERLLKHGTDPLHTTELLAIVLGSGTQRTPVLELSTMLLSHFGGLKQLSQATIEELMLIDGIGEAKAIQLKACFALGCRASSTPIAPKARIAQPDQAYLLIKEQMEKESRELLMVILQDVHNKLICSQVVSIGTVSKTMVHPREVFYPAIRHKASSMIIAHNHPSGDPTPSKEDYEVTDQLVEAGRMMGIPIVDHLVVGAQSYVSFRARGYKF